MSTADLLGIIVAVLGALLGQVSAELQKIMVYVLICCLVLAVCIYIFPNSSDDDEFEGLLQVIISRLIIVIIFIGAIMYVLKPYATDNTNDSKTEDQIESVEEESQIQTIETMVLGETEQIKKLKYNWKYLDTKSKIFRYEDDFFESKFLIDVSSHQGEIDWERVADTGLIEECILRIGSGEAKEEKIDTYVDRKFEDYYLSAIDAGISVFGVYYASVAVDKDEAIKEANAVVKELNKMKVSSDAIVYLYLYVEKTSDRHANLSADDIKRIVNAFAEVIQMNGYIAGVYTNVVNLRPISLNQHRMLSYLEN